MTTLRERTLEGILNMAPNIRWETEFEEIDQKQGSIYVGCLHVFKNMSNKISALEILKPENMQALIDTIDADENLLHFMENLTVELTLNESVIGTREEHDQLIKQVLDILTSVLNTDERDIREGSVGRDKRKALSQRINSWEKMTDFFVSNKIYFIAFLVFINIDYVLNYAARTHHKGE